MRRIGVLTSGAAADDPDGQVRSAAFVQGLQQLGWTDGRNIRIDYRWGAGDADNMRKYAAELVALAPDVILASGTASVAPLLQATRTVPIVFVQVTDPVSAGFVDSLAHPGGNATGFLLFEYAISAKMAGVTQRDRAACEPGGHPRSGANRRDRPVRRNPVRGAVARDGCGAINLRDAPEIERGHRGLRAFREWRPDPDIERVVGRSSRDLIVTLAARRKLPAVYYRRQFVTGGGLISYGPDVAEQNRRAAGYVDRIPKGRKACRSSGPGSDKVRAAGQP